MRMTDASGRTYVIEFGEPLELATFAYQERPTDDGMTFRIDARNLKELRTLLGRVKAKHSEFDLDEAMQHAVMVRNWPDGMLHGQLQIGPRVVFPALFASASIFAVHHGHQPHPQLRDFVARFDPDKPVMPPDTFYFIPALPWISAPGEVTHIVALLTSAEREEMLVYLELFNAAQVAVRLPYAGSEESEDDCVIYAVDVLTGTEVQARIDEKAIRDLPWRATHELGDAELYQFTQERIGRLIGLSQKRAWNAEVEALKTRAFGTGEDRPLTPKDLVTGIAEVVEFLLLEWRRPLIALERIEEGLCGFDRLCSEFERMIATPDREAFRALIAPHRQRLGIFVERQREQSGA